MPGKEMTMNAKLNRMMKNESGITALETAIILIAFVVVAAIFSFTVLSTGTFLTERSKEAAYAGLQEVRGSMELKGSIVVHAAAGAVTSLDLTVATVAGGSSVDLTDLSATTAKVQITYHDKTYNDILVPSGTADATHGSWKVLTCPNCTGVTNHQILGPGALATLQVIPNTTASGAGGTLVPYGTFAVEIKPPTGGVMLIERTLPAEITNITDLH